MGGDAAEPVLREYGAAGDDDYVVAVVDDTDGDGAVGLGAAVSADFYWGSVSRCVGDEATKDVCSVERDGAGSAGGGVCGGAGGDSEVVISSPFSGRGVGLNTGWWYSNELVECAA